MHFDRRMHRFCMATGKWVALRPNALMTIEQLHTIFHKAKAEQIGHGNAFFEFDILAALKAIAIH